MLLKARADFWKLAILAVLFTFLITLFLLAPSPTTPQSMAYVRSILFYWWTV